MEATNISNIKEVSQDDEEYNSVVDNNEIHYDGRKDENIKEHTDGNEYDEEEVGDDGWTEDACFF